MADYQSCVIDEKGKVISYTGSIFKSKKFKKVITSDLLKKLLKGESVTIEVKEAVLLGSLGDKNSKIKYIHFVELQSSAGKMELLKHDLKNKINPVSGLIQIGNNKMASQMIEELVEFIDKNVI